MLRVVRVRRPETIADPFVRSLILRGIIAVFPAETDALEVFAEWAARVSDDDFGLFAGLENDEPDAVAVVMLPSSHAMIAPQMLLAYNEGQVAMTRLIGERVRGWLLEHGHRQMWALNLNYPDDLFLRGTAHFGRPEVVASIIEYTF